MLIISTKPVAAIIQAVSPVSIWAAAAASAGVGAEAAASSAQAALARRNRGRLIMLSSQRVGLASADADRLAQLGDENLAVADLAGLRRRPDRLDNGVD